MDSVAVVIDEADIISEEEQVPTCCLSSAEGPADIHLGPELSAQQLEELKVVCEQGKRVFTDLPLKTHLEEFTLDLLQEHPVRTKQYPLPHAKVQSVKEELDQMIHLGVIERSTSPYSSPVVLVLKKRWKDEVLHRLP